MVSDRDRRYVCMPYAVYPPVREWCGTGGAGTPLCLAAVSSPLAEKEETQQEMKFSGSENKAGKYVYMWFPLRSCTHAVSYIYIGMKVFL